MKRFILFVATLLILISNLQGQWQVLNEGVKGSIITIDFINKNIGWIAGSDGLLLKTQDGGQMWKAIPLDKNWYIKKLDFVNESVGWAIGNDYFTYSEPLATIAKTFDGGQTWSTLASWPNSQLNLMQVMNADVVYAVGSQHNPYSFSNDVKIFKTINGGVNWLERTPRNISAYPESIWFFNSQVGLVTGTFHPSDTTQNAFVWSTHNGGMTWEETIIPEFPGISDFQFIDDSTAYFLAREKAGSILCKTTDRFKSWSIIYQDTSWISSFYYLGNNHFCVNNSTSFSGSFGPSAYYISKSMDGGRTWEQKLAAGAWGLNQMFFINDQIGFSVGGGTILKTIDGGETWSVEKFSYSFENVCFTDRMKGFAGGGWLYIHLIGGGDMFVTEDGGKTWQPNLIIDSKIESCVFVNVSLGFALSRVIGVGSWLLKTVDGGENWIEIKIPNYFEGKDVYFKNAQIGWAVGHHEGLAIVATMDGGENWQLAWHKEISEGRNYLNSITFVNDSTGWAVGDCGTIVKYTTQSQWREQTAITDLPLNKVFFIDENKGFVAGGHLYEDFHSCFFKTIDGGESWIEIPKVPYLIHDIYFYDQQHGWAVGTDSSYAGVILATEDGGDHWAVQLDSLIGPLNSLSHRDGFLWAVGDYGLVLRTGLTTAVKDDDDQHFPSEFKLAQNYPNPFNASTAISYQLSADSQVEMSIFNLLGQRVATLVSAKQSVGSYKMEWDGVDFSSGVYFCRMESGDFVKVIKLALVK
jgi:photosystem II stability/assembly factor-like uncharacterized protein